MSLFDCLNAINYKNKSYKYNKKDCNGYMLLLWFSHDKECISIVDEINRYLFSMNDEMVYNCLYSKIPRKKRFIKWDKGIKDKKLLKKEEKIIKKLRDLYGFSEFESKTLYKLYIKDK